MTPHTEETVLWKGSPSQWTNFGTYFFCLVLIAAVVVAYYFTPNRPVLILAAIAVPLLFAFVRWWQTRSQKYEITTDRSTGNLVLRAVPAVSALKDQVRVHTERMRQLRGVRDLEINPQ